MINITSGLVDLEELTTNAKQIQENVLQEILTRNAHTEYLQRFLHGSSAKELFKKNVPVVTYDDVKPYIERVANGEPSDVISGNPITGFFLSSGTSGGKLKMLPMNNYYFENMILTGRIWPSFISKFVDGAEAKKEMGVIFSRPLDTTPSGLPASPVMTSFLMSDYFKNQPSTRYTSPKDVTLCPDNKQRQMDQYIPTLDFYSNKLPILSIVYASSETVFGINVVPLCKPQDVSYTFLPNMSYFEFIRVDEENKDEIVDLVNVKIGCYYEPVVTNYAGLHRYRIGDILQVTGFYNSAPQFRFIRRKEMVLSIQMEATTEEHILQALNHATLILKASDLMLMGVTCYADISTSPGHYVFYWELKSKNNNGGELANKVLVECCCVMEESLDALYREFRNKEGSIGALEIRVVQRGTFDSLTDFFVSRGSSTSQYKTPMCINSPQVLAILEDKVIGQFFSDKSPPL